MSSGRASPFHSSSDCSTAHILQSHSRPSDDGSSHTARSAPTTWDNTSHPPPTATSATTLIASDAFVSPRSAPPTLFSVGAASASPVANTPTTARGPAARRRRATSLSITVAAEPTTPSLSAPNPRSPVAAQSPSWIVDEPLQRSYFISPAVSPVAPRHSSLVDASRGAPVQSPHLSVSQRAASSPLVPTSRGVGSGRLRTQEVGGGTAGNSHALPPLPPPSRLPSAFFSNAGSRCGSGVGTPSSSTPAAIALMPTPPEAPLRSDAGEAAPQPLAAVTAAADERGSWWAAARQFISDRGEQVNAYIEGLVNPGGVAAEARARRSRDQRRPPRVPERSATMSRSVSTSSGHESGYDPTRRTPPAHAPSPASHGTARRRATFEPYNSATPTHRDEADPHGDGSGGDGGFSIPLDLVVIDPTRDPFAWNNPAIEQPVVHMTSRDAINDSFMSAGDGAASDVDGYDGEPNSYVVDLLSALRGYNANPSEPFGHLVAAALASRSRQAPVRGFEVAAAEHHPYLVRLIVDSGTLDETDAEAQRHVQETMEEVVCMGDGELSPAIYEYLTSFFRMPFVRLSHSQYTLLKRSGFEYVKLLYEHQHVLPDEPLLSILVNQSHFMHVLNVVFMVLHLCALVSCTVSTALVLANWMRLDGGNFQSYGFYTLIVFGGGWALYLICLMYTMRNRSDESRYEGPGEDGTYVMVPSPYVAVVPVLPLFDIFCIAAYVRALRQRRMILAHNIVACSRLSGVFYAITFAFPQLVTQAYFNNVETTIDAAWRHRWPYTLVLVVTITQWCLALFGYAWHLFTHDSVDGFGFACFNILKDPHLLERHSAVVHVLHYVMASVLETNVYLATATAIDLPSETCNSYRVVVVTLASVTIAYILVVYLVILSAEAWTVRISFSCVPLMLLQLALLICSERIDLPACADVRQHYFREAFIFGYLSWGAYFALFIAWLMLMLHWCVLCGTQVNLFPRLLWPLARKDPRFTAAKSMDPDGALFHTTSTTTTATTAADTADTASERRRGPTAASGRAAASAVP
ncbi:hypothetical protein NESM_000202800 [Novymonas esmeraldas]|uniref:Transmembrane protein n=1 Tax=Novymonas esmeraldas TaxID=1808958 RepID=A0AAW0F546_9TRYP